MESQSSQLCPSCDNEITQGQVNISEGVALCNACGKLSRLSQLNYSGVTSSEALESTVPGASVSSTYDGLRISISLFSIPNFLGSLAATLFWNGIVSVFLSIAAAGIYYNLVGPVPEWFSVPGIEDGVPIMNDKPMGLGVTIFLCLFLTPFVVIGACLIANTLLRLWGTTEILISQPLSSVSTGVFLLRLKSRFSPSEVAAVGRSESKYHVNDRPVHSIEITSTRTTKFGRLLSNHQQDWLIVLLRAILIHKKSPKNIHGLNWSG